MEARAKEAQAEIEERIEPAWGGGTTVASQEARSTNKYRKVKTCS
jgi:hypothetical protein